MTTLSRPVNRLKESFHRRLEYEISTQATAEIVDLLKQDHVDLHVVHWFAGEEELSSAQLKRLETLCHERADCFHSDLLFVLTGRLYPENEAHARWDQIIAHRNHLSLVLGRNPGINVAALDWLNNIKPEDSEEFSLIGSDNLRNMRARSVIDGLTRLYDHETSLKLLEKEVERAKRYHETLAVLLLDLDDFKMVNDQFGHQKGDNVLIQMADTVFECIRTMDIAGRYGGDEFIVILPETQQSAAEKSAERVRKAFEKRFRKELKLTLSVGVACFPDDGVEAHRLIKRADTALYQAKGEGKNRVVRWRY